MGTLGGSTGQQTRGECLPAAGAGAPHFRHRDPFSTGVLANEDTLSGEDTEAGGEERPGGEPGVCRLGLFSKGPPRIRVSNFQKDTKKRGSLERDMGNLDQGQGDWDRIPRPNWLGKELLQESFLFFSFVFNVGMVLPHPFLPSGHLRPLSSSFLIDGEPLTFLCRAKAKQKSGM